MISIQTACKLLPIVTICNHFNMTHIPQGVEGKI